MLTQADIVPYLLHRKLVSVESVVEGDLTVINASRRNHNFGILREHNQSYLLKQGIDPERNETIANEAGVYQFLHSDKGRNGLNRYLPRYCGYDAAEHVLVLEFLSDAQDLGEYHARHRRFSTRIAASMGDALSLLHRKRWGNGVNDGQVFTHPPPWVLSIHRPDLGILHDISGANIQVIKIVQQYSEFCDLLDDLRQDWRAEAFIHFDIKWDNCLVSSRSAAGRKTRLTIIDWELAGAGDPSWDVGSVFAAYLSFWLLSIPVTGETPPDRFLQLARFPLERMQPALRSFWQSYVRRMGLDAITADERLLKAVKYGAARLAQASYEQMQTATQLIGNVVCSLQLSLNILRKPKDAVVHLLGLPLSSI
ncbi:MAG: phosphotransferase [Nitrospirota bacterium]